jgi:thiazole synthase
MLGTGKYRSPQVMAECHRVSGAEIITVAVRRVRQCEGREDSILRHLDGHSYFLLPNTAGCRTAEQAVPTAHLAREAGLSHWIKLEVIGDDHTLFPDNEGLFQATRILVKDGFVVLPYTTDDLISAHKLIDAGAAAVMPMGVPIGSGLGIQNRTNLQILREQVTSVPLIVDAGVGTASDAVVAMELGYDAARLNTAVASARDSLAMARAMRHAVIAGRLAFEAGRIGRFPYANASSPGPDFSGPTPFPAATFQEYSSRHADRGAPNAG